MSISASESNRELYRAVRHHNRAEIMRLLGAGATPLAYGCGTLMQAIEAGTADAFMEYTLDDVDLGCRQEVAETAARYGDVHWLEKSASSSDYYSLFEVAALSGQVEVLKFLSTQWPPFSHDWGRAWSQALSLVLKSGSPSLVDRILSVWPKGAPTLDALSLSVLHQPTSTISLVANTVGASMPMLNDALSVAIQQYRRNGPVEEDKVLAVLHQCPAHIHSCSALLEATSSRGDHTLPLRLLRQVATICDAAPQAYLDLALSRHGALRHLVRIHPPSKSASRDLWELCHSRPTAPFSRSLSILLDKMHVGSSEEERELFRGQRLATVKRRRLSRVSTQSKPATPDPQRRPVF